MSSRMPSIHRHVVVLLIVLFLGASEIAPNTQAQRSTDRQSTHPRISTQVLQLADKLRAGAIPQAADEQHPGAIRLSATGEIGVEVRIDGPTAQAAAAFAALGVRVGAWSDAFPLVGAWVRPEQLDALAALPMVVYVDPMLTPVVRSGSVISLGDAVLRADQVRNTFGLSGAGVRVGVISDGVDRLPESQSSGDLPPTCSDPFLGDSSSCVRVDPNNPGSGKEGGAILEIIHDLAPGAILGFSSGINGVTGFVAAIDFLQNDFRADVIIDDIGYLNEPFFEDGTIGTRAQQAVEAGVVFVSAAGNDANKHYQAPLETPANCPTGTPRQCLHRFAPDDTSQTFLLPNGQTIVIVLQWNNPFDNAVDDLDLYLLSNGAVLRQSVGNQFTTRQPFEYIKYENFSGVAQFVDVVVDAVALRSGTIPEIEMLFVAPGEPEYLTRADSMYGHPAMPGVIGVGAVPDQNPTLIQPYSSQGPVTISHPSSETRLKPDLVATDCVATSTEEFSTFCGTSAAAPHVAAVAALLLEQKPSISPAQVRELLVDGAVDLGTPAFDTIYGAGRADALNSIMASTSETTTVRVMLPLIIR